MDANEYEQIELASPAALLLVTLRAHANKQPGLQRISGMFTTEASDEER